MTSKFRALNLVLIASLVLSAILKLLSVFMLITTGSKLLILGLVQVAVYSFLIVGIQSYKRGMYIMAMIYIALSSRVYFSSTVPYAFDSVVGVMNILAVVALVVAFVLSGAIASQLTPSAEGEVSKS